MEEPVDDAVESSDVGSVNTDGASTPQVDERGVPIRNLHAEMSRKLERLESRMSQTIAESQRIKDAEIAQLRAELAAARAKPPEPKEEFSKEDLLRAYANAADNPEMQAQIMDRLTDLKSRQAQQEIQAVSQQQQMQAGYNALAVQRFPELSDPTHPFYVEVARNLDGRIQRGEVNHRAILDAAYQVAGERPDLVKREAGNNGAVPRGSWGDRGSRPGGAVSNKQEELPQLDQSVHQSWKQAFPKIDDERVRRRQAAIKKRLIYGGGNQ